MRKLWPCPRCEVNRVGDEDELCPICREEIEEGEDEPVDVRMSKGYANRLAEGWDHER